MRILFVDDDPEHVILVSRLLAEVLGARVDVVDTVEAAVVHLHGGTYDLVVTDIFIPMGARPAATLGPRAYHYAENVQHLGGLVLLDEIERVSPRPPVLAHTACTDFALIEVLGDSVAAKVPKPAPPDVLLRAVLEILDLPVPG